MTRFFLLFAFLFTTVFANQDGFSFIGISGSSQTIDFQSSVTEEPNKPENPASLSETTYGIKYGVQTQDYRTSFTLGGNKNFQTADVEIDYMLVDELFGTPKIRPYIGATLGYIMYDKELITQYNDNRFQNDANLTSVAQADGYYGLNVGLVFYLTENIDLDVGFHYYLMDRLQPLDVMNGATFSLHYFY